MQALNSAYLTKNQINKFLTNIEINVIYYLYSH